MLSPMHLSQVDWCGEGETNASLVMDHSLPNVLAMCIALIVEDWISGSNALAARCPTFDLFLWL